MRSYTLAELEQALTDSVHRLWAARDRQDLEAEMVYEAQVDRLLGWWQSRGAGVEVGKHRADSAAVAEPQR